MNFFDLLKIALKSRQEGRKRTLAEQANVRFPDRMPTPLKE